MKRGCWLPIVAVGLLLKLYWHAYYRSTNGVHSPLLTTIAPNTTANNTTAQSDPRASNLTNSSRRNTLVSWQPRVWVVEAKPARKVFGSLSQPLGSPWCRGRPTYWLTGHQPEDERPWCWNQSEWTQDLSMALLDSRDSLNQSRIDRHQCVAVDVNRDGIADIVCLVGAEKGRGAGYNELYLTQSDGSVVKVPLHGLQKYPSMRTRLAVALKDYTGPYFEEVEGGPWVRYFEVNAAMAADVTGDGLDDLILCTLGAAVIYVQRIDGSWQTLPGVTGPHVTNWSSARVADVSGDGRPDLVVIDTQRGKSYVKVFRGVDTAPYFYFASSYHTRALEHDAPDLEVLDVDGDGRLDIYVVQVSRTGYCELGNPFKDDNGNVKLPPATWMPPNDNAADVLLVNQGHVRPAFRAVAMSHRRPGCGFLVQAFGNKKLVLAQGDRLHPGYNLLLEWS